MLGDLQYFVKLEQLQTFAIQTRCENAQIGELISIIIEDVQPCDKTIQRHTDIIDNFSHRVASWSFECTVPHAKA